MTLTSQSNESLSFVEAVCLRPRMYTLNGSLEEVLCFLQRFYTGMSTHAAFTSAPALVAHYAWFDFLAYCAQFTSSEPSESWIGLYRYLHQNFPDPQLALQQLALYHKSYRAISPPPNLRI